MRITIVDGSLLSGIYTKPALVDLAASFGIVPGSLRTLKLSASFQFRLGDWPYARKG